MIRSMTGFAAAEGGEGPFAWSWELRSVNAKGLDLRLRVPDWIEGLEPALRKALTAALGRGSVTLNLKLSRAGDTAGLQLNPAVLDAMLAAVAEVETRAMALGQSLAPATAADILSLRGVLDVGDTSLSSDEITALRTTLMAECATLLDAFVATRAAEGERLHAALTRDLEALEARISAAQEAAEARLPQARIALSAALTRITETTEAVTEERLAQELALLAVKSDVTEEIDRLQTHVAAARDLLATEGPVGRRFDFLMQEFNREANTLCAKSGDADLTAIGLEMKTLIDQLREQVQNVE